MNMKPIEVRARDAADAPMEPAALLVCDCGSETFVAFQLARHDHPHLQCTACGTSYCSGKACRDEAAAAAQGAADAV